MASSSGIGGGTPTPQPGVLPSDVQPTGVEDAGAAQEAGAPAPSTAAAGQQIHDADAYGDERVAVSQGPQDGTAGVAGDSDLDPIYDENGLPSPYNGNSTPQVETRARQSEGWQEGVDALDAAMKNPTDPKTIGNLHYSAGKLAQSSGGNVLEILHLLMKDSIKEDNETKKYVLQKLQTLNKISDFLSEQLRKVADASSQLATRDKDGEGDQKVRVEYELPSLDGVDSNGNVYVNESYSKSVNRNGVQAQSKKIDNALEQCRDKKQMIQTEFQHLDQIVNQTMTTLSRVLKTLQDLRMLGAASRSGM